MFYTKSLTVETTHTKKSPLEYKVKAWAGRINHIGLFSRPGCAGTTRLQFWIGGHQIHPTEPGTYFIPTQYPLRFLDDTKLKVGENEIIIKAWSVDSTYAHQIMIELGIIKEIRTIESRINELKKTINNQTYGILQAMKRNNIKK